MTYTKIVLIGSRNCSKFCSNRSLQSI